MSIDASKISHGLNSKVAERSSPKSPGESMSVSVALIGSLMLSAEALAEIFFILLESLPEDLQGKLKSDQNPHEVLS